MVVLVNTWLLMEDRITEVQYGVMVPCEITLVESFRTAVQDVESSWLTRPTQCAG